MFHELVLITGSNLGNPIMQLEKARAAITEYIGSVHKTSSVWKTAPWGKTDQPDFYNQVLVAKTTLSPGEVLKAIHKIERAAGRERKEKYAARPLDIDILFYDNAVIDLPGLTVPHPHIAERGFVLAPLAEVLPRFVHPALNKEISRLLTECSDQSAVDKLNPSARD